MTLRDPADASAPKSNTNTFPRNIPAHRVHALLYPGFGLAGFGRHISYAAFSRDRSSAFMPFRASTYLSFGSSSTW